MFEIDASNAREYLGRRGVRARRITALGGGVSNTVLLVETEESRFVLKQALGKLRVEQDWRADRVRIFRESAALQAVAPVLPDGAVPAVLWEDRENFLFAMTAAPAQARTWKELLLGGEIDPAVARTVGDMLGRIVSTPILSRAREQADPNFDNLDVFDQLRLDPYYRATARHHPDLAHRFEELIDDCRTRRVSLVHGDWSPKNFLVHDGHVMAIDFEVCHFGNPAFDCAFLLNHLLLKSFYRPQSAPGYVALAGEFWSAFSARAPEHADWLLPATLSHLGGLLLARVDGKSPAEYIASDELRNRVRSWGRQILADPPRTIADAFSIVCTQSAV